MWQGQEKKCIRDSTPNRCRTARQCRTVAVHATRHSQTLAMSPMPRVRHQLQAPHATSNFADVARFCPPRSYSACAADLYAALVLVRACLDLQAQFLLRRQRPCLLHHCLAGCYHRSLLAGHQAAQSRAHDSRQEPHQPHTSATSVTCLSAPNAQACWRHAGSASTLTDHSWGRRSKGTCGARGGSMQMEPPFLVTHKLKEADEPRRTHCRCVSSRHVQFSSLGSC